MWWRHFGGGRALVGTGGDDAGAPVVLVALEVRGPRPLRVGRFIGHGAADELGPLCAPGSEELAARVLEELAGEVDVLLAERMPPRLAAGLRGRPVQREPSPVIAVPDGGWEEFLSGRSSNFRSQVRRKERKLLKDRGLSYRLVETEDELDPAMDALVDLHNARWGEVSDAFDEKRAAFHRDFARAALERGWLRLWLAEIDERPVAAWYGFRFADAEWYYQSGRDPAFERDSIGLVLLAHTIREAMNDGVREYKLLRGGESYKDRFATGDEGLETRALGRGPVGRGAAAAVPTAVRARRALRQRLRRPSVFL